MRQYNVTGMSCAACSARVEKAVGKVPGVTSCSVSLLTNSMGVEGTAEPSAILAAVEAAGYGASEKGAAQSSPSAGEQQLEDRETPRIRTAAYLVRGLSAGADVLFHGPHDVGLAPAAVLRQQPCGHGADPAAADGDHHGHQPEVLHQRL